MVSRRQRDSDEPPHIPRCAGDLKQFLDSQRRAISEGERRSLREGRSPCDDRPFGVISVLCRHGRTYAVLELPVHSKVSLSPRYREVAALWAAGTPAARIATLLGLRHDTARSYISRMCRTLGVKTRPDVFAFMLARYPDDLVEVLSSQASDGDAIGLVDEDHGIDGGDSPPPAGN